VWLHVRGRSFRHGSERVPGAGSHREAPQVLQFRARAPAMPSNDISTSTRASGLRRMTRGIGLFLFALTGLALGALLAVIS